MGDLDENLKDASMKKLRYVDNSKIIVDLKNEEDVYTAQEAMAEVFLWAEVNNMK